MKKQLLISALLAVSMLTSGMTAFAEGESDPLYTDEDAYYEEYTDENTDEDDIDEEVYDRAVTGHADDDFYDSSVDTEYLEKGKDYYTERAAFVTENIYLCDETKSLTQTHIDAIRRQLEETYQNIHNNIAVYIAETDRSSDVPNFVQNGVDTVFSNPGMVTHTSDTTIIDTVGTDPDGTLFLYIDTQNFSCTIKQDFIAARYYDDSSLDSLAESLSARFYGTVPAYVTNMVNDFCIRINSLRTDFYDNRSHSDLTYHDGHYVYDYTGYYDYPFYKDDTVYYCDESQNYTDSQKEQIVSLLKETSDTLGFNLAMYTAGKSRTDEEVENFAVNGSHEIFGLSPETGTVFLYLDLDGYSNAYDVMYCYREPFLYYSSELFGNRIEKILVEMSKHLPKGGNYVDFDSLYAATQEFCKQLIYYKEMGPEEGCYYYNDDTDTFFVTRHGEIVQTDTMPRSPYKQWPKFLLIGLGIGIIAAILLYFSVLKEYEFKSSASASLYTSRNTTHIHHKSDVLIGTHVSKVRIESHSSGGHGGHGGHGGGFHGGGFSGGGGGGHHR